MDKFAKHCERVAASLPIKVAILLLAALGSLTLVSSSVYATISATYRMPTTQSFSTGTMTLKMADNTTAGISAGMTIPITNMGAASGDVTRRYVNLFHGGTLTGGQMLFGALQNELPTPLTKDPNFGLYVAIRECSVPWTPPATCNGTVTVAMQSTSVQVIQGNFQPIILSTGAPGTTNYLQFSFRTPPNNESVVDGFFPSNSVQGQTQTMTWVFMENPANVTSNS